MLVNVRTSSVIHAPIQQVWEKIRDFNSLPSWYPSAIESFIENGVSSNTIGCIRQYNRQDGLTIREQLLGFNDLEYTCTYLLLQPAQPMTDYVGRLRLLPVTDGDLTYIEWCADFNCPLEQKEELHKAIEQVFQVGFDGLKAIFN